MVCPEMNLLSSKTNSQGTVKTRYFLLYLAYVHERRFLCVLVLCVCNGNTVAGQHGTRDERGMLRHVPVEFKPEISRYSKTRYFLLYLACVHESFFSRFSRGPYPSVSGCCKESGRFPFPFDLRARSFRSGALRALFFKKKRKIDRFELS